MNDKTHRINKFQCPDCGYNMDCCTELHHGREGDAGPRVGDYTLCLNCAELHVFARNIDEQLYLESPSDKDRQALETSAQGAMLKQMQAMIKNSPHFRKLQPKKEKS